MSTTGELIQNYLEVAITEAGAAHILKNPDVRHELDELVAAIDRLAPADAFALGALSTIRDRLSVLETRIAALEQSRP